MRALMAGALSGLVAGVAMSAAMAYGRRCGLLYPTMAERSEDWLDRNFETRRTIGETGTEVLELTTHVGGSMIFGAIYGALYSALRRWPAACAGTLFGAGLYLLNIAGLAPVLGVTRGEWRQPASVIGQRLGMHVLFGTVTAMLTAALLRR